MDQFHQKPFDEATQTKLALWKMYLENAFGVFLTQVNTTWHKKYIRIYDFLCGSGTDSEGRPGSPLITLEVVNKFLSNPSHQQHSNTITIELYFNDSSEDKIKKLNINIQSIPLPRNVKIFFSTYDFNEALENWYSRMNDSANLIFIDQYGIDKVSKDVFLKICRLEYTDFLFFISSSIIYRFQGLENISNKLPGISKKLLDSDKNYHNIHRLVTETYRSYTQNLPKKYYISNFSLKKGSNIYGLIFGSNHILGLEKFLEVAWKLDPKIGEANYDIDKDNYTENAPTLFSEYNVRKKEKQFEEDIKKKILDTPHMTDKELYYFCIENGFLERHLKKALKALGQELNLKLLYNPKGKPYKKDFVPSRLRV